MKCPLCGKDTIVLDSRFKSDDNIIRRRRECLTCGHRFTTKEIMTSTYDPLYKTLVSYDGGKTWIDKEEVKPKLSKLMVSYDNGESWQIEKHPRRKDYYGRNNSV